MRLENGEPNRLKVMIDFNNGTSGGTYSQVW